ncbi:DUF6787 family protein [Gracilimonas sp.]|uniref:DUF6787 family protein n=1 Tax=Gracilimonas sp. TaxID=1974203 RepID=UPI002871F144|nr:prolipoprotein diacylglyceryl transferase [Gracilimonas sp.]
MQFFNKLKSKWGIESNWQVLIIMLVFSLTGFSALYARRFLFPILGVEATDPFWFKTFIWLLTIFPMYNIFLLIYAAIFGQFEFFWTHLKKTFSRIKGLAPGK